MALEITAKVPDHCNGIGDYSKGFRSLLWHWRLQQRFQITAMALKITTKVPDHCNDIGDYNKRFQITAMTLETTAKVSDYCYGIVDYSKGSRLLLWHWRLQ